MRDPARIDRVLALLRELWVCDPDYRFMQLIYRELGFNDHFYLEDDKLIEILETSRSSQASDRE